MENDNVSFGSVLKGFLNPKVLIVLFIILTPTLIAFFAWSEKVFDPVRGLVGKVLGNDVELAVAFETDEYFRTIGKKIDWQWGDLEAIIARSKELDTYRITINEVFSDPKSGFLNPGLFRVEQHIIFESRENLIKIQIIPQEIVLSDRAIFYESLFRNYHLAPFGIYYIIPIDGEKHILMYSGQIDGNYMRKRSVVRARDNMALYNKLMSYSIENIIDYTALRNKNDLECFQVSGGMREYSTQDADSENYSDIYLRVLRSMPAAYLMKYDISRDNLRRRISAEFSYNDRRINKTVPLMSDFLNEER